MSANARIPIDLNDPKIPLTEALKVLLEFIAEVQQKHFLDAQRQTIYVRDLVWIMLNGHLPRENEWTEVNQAQTLAGWTGGMLYNSSRSLVRDGLSDIGGLMCANHGTRFAQVCTVCSMQTKTALLA